MSVPIAKGVSAAASLDRVRSASSERSAEPSAETPPAAAARPRWRRWLSMLNPLRKRVCPYPGHDSFANAPWLIALGWLVFAIITLAKCVTRSRVQADEAASSRSSSSASAKRDECTWRTTCYTRRRR